MEKSEADLQEVWSQEAVSTLASGLTHDLNNMLAIILGFSELTLVSMPEHSNARENLRQVLKASQRARELILQFHTCCCPEKVRNRRPVQLGKLLRKMLHSLRGTLPASVELRQQIQDEARFVLADSEQLRKVFFNLCSNAVEAMHQSGGVLEVGLTGIEFDAAAAARQKLPKGTYLRLSVKDTGCGMSPDILDRIFNPYFTTNPRGEGSGLGLALVHGIVQRHQGAVAVTSTPGQGTTFHVLLPITDAREDKEEMLPPHGQGGLQRVLYVDDEKALVALGEKMLTRLGYEVVATDNSRKALELFRARPDDFDLIFTDYNMPHLTGADLAAEALRIRRDIPVILCSGCDEAEIRRQAQKLGIRQLVRKPLRSERLAAIVQQALAKG